MKGCDLVKDTASGTTTDCPQPATRVYQNWTTHHEFGENIVFEPLGYKLLKESVMKTMKKTFQHPKDELKKETIVYRPDSSDALVIEEILGKKQCYRKVSIGFTIEAGEHWLDLGANIGAFVKYASLQGASCEAYEPEAECFRLLGINSGSCDTASKNRIYRAAVSCEKTKSIAFYTSPREHDHYRGTVVLTGPRSRYVPTGHVDNVYAPALFRKRKWDGVKMDIEGAEIGMIDNEFIPRCEKLVLEYHFTRDKLVSHMRNRMKILKKYFKVVNYRPCIDNPEAFPNDRYNTFHDPIVYCLGWKGKQPPYMKG
jgi:FkbM family methyltransferase